MHIGLLIYGNLELQSGGFFYDRQMVAYLRSQGDCVTVVSLPWPSYPRSLLDNFSWSMQSKLQNGGWDILVQDELVHPSVASLNRKLRAPGRPPLISLVHLLRSGSQPWRAWQDAVYRTVERRYLNTLDGCIYVSENNRRLAETLGGRSIPSIVAYPAGDHLRPHITQDAMVLRANQAGPLQVLYVGSLIPRKALHVLLEALQTLPADTWELTIIGSPNADPAYANRVQHQSRQMGLEQRVHFMGALPNSEVGQYMTKAHLLAMPSTSEGYAIVYLEAFAHGLPVIATAASGAVELVQPGENGYLVQPGDVPGIAACISRLAANRDLLRRMSVRARQAYEAHPTWEDSGAAIRQFLMGFLN